MAVGKDGLILTSRHRFRVVHPGSTTDAYQGSILTSQARHLAACFYFGLTQSVSGVNPKKKMETHFLKRIVLTAPPPPPPKYLDMSKGAPLRLPKRRSEQLPVRVCTCALCVYTVCGDKTVSYMKQFGGLPGKHPHVAGAAPRRVFLFRVNPERFRS